MPAVYCEIIKHALGPRSAFEMTLFGQIYDLAAATRLGIVQQTVAPDMLLEAAVAWAALVPPDCHTAYAFSKRALQATTMAAIDDAARLDKDLLSRGMSDLESIRAHTRRYKELKGKDVSWPLPIQAQERGRAWRPAKDATTMSSQTTKRSSQEELMRAGQTEPQARAQRLLDGLSQPPTI